MMCVCVCVLQFPLVSVLFQLIHIYSVFLMIVRVFLFWLVTTVLRECRTTWTGSDANLANDFLREAFRAYEGVTSLEY